MKVSTRVGTVLKVTVLAASSAVASAEGDPDTPVLRTEMMQEAADASASPAPANHETSGDSAPSGLQGEFYTGLFGGNVEAADTTVSGIYQCYFCVPVSDQATSSLGGGGVFGLRGGYWSTRGALNPGIAFEASAAGVSGDRVSLHYQGYGISPMVRLPLRRSTEYPGGRLNPYAGLHLYRLAGGSMEVNLPVLPRSLSGTPAGSANGFLVGLAARFGAVEVAGELRKVRVDVSMDSMAGDDARFDPDTTQWLLVLNYYPHR